MSQKHTTSTLNHTLNLEGTRDLASIGGEALIESSQKYSAKDTTPESLQGTWKPRHYDKVYQTTKEAIVNNPPPSLDTTHGAQCMDAPCKRCFIMLTFSRGILFNS